MSQKDSQVNELLQKTHQQVGISSEEGKIQYAKKSAGFGGWFAGAFAKLGVKDFRAMIEGKNLLSQKSKEKK